MLVLILIKKIISLFLILFAGVLLVKLKIVKSEDSRILSMITLYLITPCVIINAFQIDINEKIISGLKLSMLAAVGVYILLLALNVLFKRLLKLNPVEQCSTLYPNAANLIIPLVTAMFGEEMVIYTTSFICVQLILLWSHAKSTLCEEKKIDIKKILTNINLISVFIGILFLLTGIKITGPLQDAMTSLSSMVGPVCMLITGMLIGNVDLKKTLANKRLWMVTAIRLIVVPILVLVFLRISHLSSLAEEGENILLITFLATMTPSASTIVQMAQVYDQDAEYASAINVATTLLCIITMPIMVFLYTSRIYFSFM